MATFYRPPEHIKKLEDEYFGNYQQLEEELSMTKKKDYPDTPEGHHAKNNDTGRNGKFRPGDEVRVKSTDTCGTVKQLDWHPDKQAFLVRIEDNHGDSFHKWESELTLLEATNDKDGN